jgi:hypothetical protein
MSVPVPPAHKKRLDQWAETLYRSVDGDPSRLELLPRLRRLLGILILIIGAGVASLAHSVTIVLPSVAFSWAPGIFIGAGLCALGALLLVGALFIGGLGVVWEDGY